MPFTVSHIAAVLPAARFPALRDPLILSAFAVGAMSPDVPYFIPSRLLPSDAAYATGHTWTGLLVQDLPVTLALVALYWAVLAAPLRALAPSSIRRRLPTGVLAAHRTAPWRAVALVIMAATIGAMTHIVWDAFTHEGRFGVMAVPWLQLPAVVGPLPAYRVLQYASSIIGLALVGWSLLRWYRTTPVSAPADDGLGRRWQVAFAAAVGGAAVIGWWSVRGLALQASDLYGLHVMLFEGLSRSVALVATVVLVIALVARPAARDR